MCDVKKAVELVFINKSKIHFETYSQPEAYKAGAGTQCLSINQRYILKPIHNMCIGISLGISSVYQ